MPDLHANFAYSTVATAPSPATSGTSLVVAAGTGTLFPAVPFDATIWATGVNALSTNAEIVRVTARSTDTLTITRAQESTSARTVVVGDQIAATITKKTLTDAETAFIGRTTFSNANYTALTTDIYVAQVGTMSAARTVTLPAANAVIPGQYIFVADESGTVTAANNIVVARAGADTIDGGTSASITAAYGVREFFSDGTSKWTTRITGITAGGTGQTSKVPAFNALSPNTTVGDVTVHDGTDSVRLPVGTLAGAAIAADPNAANKLSWQYPQAVDMATRGTTGSLATNFSRQTAVFANIGFLSSGRITITPIWLPKGLPVTSISIWSATTALSVGSNQWFVLADSALGKLAVTADDTSTAWAANTKKTLTVTGGPFITTYAGIYAVGVCVVATTVPTLFGINNAAGASTPGNAAPLLQGTSNTGLTNPASCPSTLQAVTNQAAILYAEIS